VLIRATALRFHRGRKVLRSIWVKTALFLPSLAIPYDTTTRASAKAKGKRAGASMSAVLGGRTVALVWVHVVGGCALLLLAIVANMHYGWIAEFRLKSKTVIALKVRSVGQWDQ